MLPIVLGCSLGNAAVLLSINLYSYLRKLKDREEFQNSVFKDNLGSLIDNGDSLLNERKSYYNFENLTPNLVALISTVGLFSSLIIAASVSSMEIQYELATLPALATLFVGSCYVTYRGVNGHDILPKCIDSESHQDAVMYSPNSTLAHTDIGGSVYR